MLLSSGKLVEIQKIEKETLKEPVKVYNFEVEDFHTYFVSDKDVLVHNSGCGTKVVTATKNNYRKLYLKKFPSLPEKYQVHHTLPQKYQSIMKKSGINVHEVKYLKGIHVDTHKLITKEWRNWDKALGRKPTAKEVANFAKKINKKYGKNWYNK